MLAAMALGVQRGITPRVRSTSGGLDRQTRSVAADRGPVRRGDRRRRRSRQEGRGGTLHFVAATRVGETTELKDVTAKELKAALQALEASVAEPSAGRPCGGRSRSQTALEPQRLHLRLELLEANLKTDPQRAWRRRCDSSSAWRIAWRSTSVTARCVTSARLPDRSSGASGFSGGVKSSACRFRCLRVDDVAVDEDDGALETVLQLAHVARPGIRLQRLECGPATASASSCPARAHPSR